MPLYDENNPSPVPGFYSVVKAAARAAIDPGNGGRVCVPIVGNWGPEGAPNRVTTLAAFETLYGDTENDDHFTVEGALTGDGDKTGRAKAVDVYRMPLAGNARASLTLNKTGPTAAFVVSAKHKGTYGNLVAVQSRAHPTDGTKRQLLVFVNGTLKETWSYTSTTLSELATKLNNSDTGSAWITGAVSVDGTALLDVGPSNLTGGANGTPDGTAYTEAMTAVEGVPFNFITFPNLTDPTILASARVWIATLNQTIRRAFLITGGASGEDVSDGIDRSALSSTNPDIINVGGVQVRRTDDNAVVKSTAQFTGYIAGIAAGYGTRRSLTNARIPGWELVARPSATDIRAAVTSGLVLMTMDDDGLRIEKQVTTYTADTDPMPLAVFGSILSVRVLHQIDTDLEQLTRRAWIGSVKSDQTTQDAYVGVLGDYFETLEKARVLYPGTSSVVLDPEQDNTGDTWYPLYNVTLEKAVERVLAVGTVQ